MHWVVKPKTSNIRKIDCCFVRIEPADILSQLMAEKQLSRSLTMIKNSRILYRLNWIPLSASCSCTENDRWSTVPAFLWNKCVDPKFWSVYPCLTQGPFIHSSFSEREREKCCLDLKILENYIAICGLQYNKHETNCLAPEIYIFIKTIFPLLAFLVSLIMKIANWKILKIVYSYRGGPRV